jgi:hypothetical protein
MMTIRPELSHAFQHTCLRHPEDEIALANSFAPLSLDECAFLASGAASYVAARAHFLEAIFRADDARGWQLTYKLAQDPDPDARDTALYVAIERITYLGLAVAAMLANDPYEYIRTPARQHVQKVSDALKHPLPTAHCLLPTAHCPDPAHPPRGRA